MNGVMGLMMLLSCGLISFFPSVFAGNDPAQQGVISDLAETIVENSSNTSSSDLQLGDLELSEEIDRDGCAIEPVSSLRNVDHFYVVAPHSQIPEGTNVFTRLYRDGIAIEDLPIITATQDYSNTCVNFMYETVNGQNFDSGDYEVEFFVNGDSYSSISFSID
jgi:hypothetical protein